MFFSGFYLPSQHYRFGYVARTFGGQGSQYQKEKESETRWGHTPRLLGEQGCMEPHLRARSPGHLGCPWHTAAPCMRNRPLLWAQGQERPGRRSASPRTRPRLRLPGHAGRRGLTRSGALHGHGTGGGGRVRKPWPGSRAEAEAETGAEPDGQDDSRGGQACGGEEPGEPQHLPRFPAAPERAGRGRPCSTWYPDSGLRSGGRRQAPAPLGLRPLAARSYFLWRGLSHPTLRGARLGPAESIPWPGVS